MYYLQQLVDVERIQFRICLSFLLEVRAIGLIDMFDICNIYVLQDFEALWNEAVLTDMLSYCRFQPSHNPHRIESSHAAVFAETGEESDFGDLQAILSLFHSNISVLQIIQNPVFEKVQNSIDFHRLVVYCCVHHILKRVYVVPVRTSDPKGFSSLFDSSICSTRYSANSTLNEEPVGMSMDSLGVPRLHEDDQESFASDNPLSCSRGLYKELFACFHHSLYHQEPHSLGLSRHSSCLSFQKEAQSCTCKPDRAKILQMLSQYQCLEYIALHSNCCIPAVMSCLATVDNILFLKISLVCKQTQLDVHQ